MSSTGQAQYKNINTHWLKCLLTLDSEMTEYMRYTCSVLIAFVFVHVRQSSKIRYIYSTHATRVCATQHLLFFAFISEISLAFSNRYFSTKYSIYQISIIVGYLHETMQMLWAALRRRAENSFCISVLASDVDLRDFFNKSLASQNRTEKKHN